MRIQVATVDLETQLPFITAHGGSRQHQNVLVQIEHEGLIGLGEAAPTPYHGETVASVKAALSTMIPAVEAVGSPVQLEAIHGAMDRVLAGNRAAKAAIDIACHDWMGKRVGMPLYALFGLDPTSAPPSSYTVPIVPLEHLRQAMAAGEGFGAFKVKMGDPGDGERLSQVRAATQKPIRVDANAAWNATEAIGRLPELTAAHVELLEQPVAGDDLLGLARVRDASRIPVLADEPALTALDVPRLVGMADGVNVKLAKAGGIRPALAMIQVARSLGLRIMLGCMIESSIGIAAAAHLSPLVDWVDLDGHLLLARDPARGLSLVGGRVEPRAAPGLGVELTAPVFDRGEGSDRERPSS